PRREYYHARADLYSLVEVHNVLVREPDATRGHEGADGRGLIGAVDAIRRLAKIERARAERVGLAAGHEARQIGLAHDHLLRRSPIGPFRHPRHLFRAGPSEALAADAHPVAQRLAVAEHEIEVGVRGIHDDRARRFLGAIINERATELRRQFLLRAGLGPHLWRECGHVARVAALCRPGPGRTVWPAPVFGADRHPPPPPPPPNCILFGRAGWARWDAAGYAVVRVVAFAALLRQVAVPPPLPITIGARRPVSR